MTKSYRYLNYSVAITPASGSSTTQKEIENVRIMRGATQLEAFGDAKLFPTLIVNTQEKRSITLIGGDVGDLVSLARNTTYTVVVTLLDSVNGSTASGGGLTATLSNAVIESDEYNSPNNQFGLGTMTFNAYSSNGTTDPLVIAFL